MSIDGENKVKGEIHTISGVLRNTTSGIFRTEVEIKQEELLKAQQDTEAKLLRLEDDIFENRIRIRALEERMEQEGRRGVGRRVLDRIAGVLGYHP